MTLFTLGTSYKKTMYLWEINWNPMSHMCLPTRQGRAIRECLFSQRILTLLSINQTNIGSKIAARYLNPIIIKRITSLPTSSGKALSGKWSPSKEYQIGAVTISKVLFLRESRLWEAIITIETDVWLQDRLAAVAEIVNIIYRLFN